MSFVIWQVHKDNDAVQHLSRKVVGDHDSVAGAYHLFVHELGLREGDGYE